MSTWRNAKNCPAHSPAPEFVDAARLGYYVLRFMGPDWPTWHGTPANVTKTLDERHVWGVLWKISTAHSEKLDKYAP